MGIKRWGPALLLGAAVGFTPSNAVAQEEEVKTAAFTADFGFVSSAGNTNVTTFSVGDKLMLNTVDKRLIFTQEFAAVRSEADGVKNAENYLTRFRLDRGLGSHFYAFAMAGWERNVPGGIARRFEETVGLAWKAIERPADQLSLEVGLSFFQQRNVDAPPGESAADDYTAGRVAGHYRHAFTPTTFFVQALELIPNFDTTQDFRLNTETAVIAPISSHLGVKLSYVIRYDHLPNLLPEPNPNLTRLKKTDRYLTAGLTISY